MFDLSGFVILVIKKRKFLIINFIIISIVALLYSEFIAGKQFMSSITFLPPFEEKSILSFLSDKVNLSMSTVDIIPQQITTIFESKTFRRKIVEKFDYYEKYKSKESPNKFELTLKRLKKDLVMETDEYGSFGMTNPVSYTIKLYHTSPDSSCEIVLYIFSVLDSIIRNISIDRGRRNREFILSQLNHNKNVLDSLQNKFTKFQKEKKIYNIPDQLRLAMKSYGEVKAQFLANDIKIKSLLHNYDESYLVILSLQKENQVLKSELRKIEKRSQPDIVVGLEQSADLIPVYTNHMRGLEVQNKLILLLSQQLEQAKLKEANDISSLRVIDPPFIPEYKARPKRAFLCIGIVGVYFSLLLIGFFLNHFYKIFIKKTQLFHEISSVLVREK